MLNRLSEQMERLQQPRNQRGFLLGEHCRASLFSFNEGMDKAVNPSTRGMAYESSNSERLLQSTTNEICFPAGILQPFFNMDADDAVNYGAIGGDATNDTRFRRPGQSIR